jgi:hypothetical protein
MALETVQILSNTQQAPEAPLHLYNNIKFWKNMRKLGIEVTKFDG